MLSSAVHAQDLERIVAENEPAVVIILGNRTDTGAEVQSSGCCISAEGHVITTGHQIEGVEKMTATFSDGRKMPLKVLFLDRQRELALLKTEQPSNAAVPIGNAKTLRGGSPLISIATPVNLAFSTVRGIVSSTNRTYNDYPVIQAELPASPGSSGGPVFDRYGNLVGMIIGQLETEQWVTVVNPINNAYALLEEQKLLVKRPDKEDALLDPMENASAIEKDAIDAYNAGVTAPDPAAKVRAYAKAVELVPAFFEAWFNQGVAYTQLAELDLAEKAYQKAAVLRPDALEVKRNIGRLYLRDKRLEEAVKAFEALVILAPDAPQSYNDLGEAFRQLGRTAEAIANFEKALSLDPKYAKAVYNLALACAGDGRSKEAIIHFQRYLALSPQPQDSQEVAKFIEQLSKQQQ